MVEQIVSDTMTRASTSEMYVAVRDAWRELLSEEPVRPSLLVLLAHWALETGGGGAMHCWNVGNIKHVAGDGHDYCRFRASEILNGQEKFFDMDFRAYGSLEEGVRDYLTILRGTFRYAWPAVETGDPADFAHRLKVAHYYTADESTYTHALVGRFAALDRAIAPDTLPELPQVAETALDEAANERELHDDEPPPEEG